MILKSEAAHSNPKKPKITALVVINTFDTPYGKNGCRLFRS